MSVWGTIEPEETDERMYGSMTPEQLAAWLNQRCGKLTASRAYDALHTLKKGGYAASRTNLIRELLAERLTGESMDHYVSEEMRWGLKYEPDAKMAYETRTGNLIEACTYRDHPTIDNLGATPDGRVGRGGIEAKCPKTSTFIDWLRGGTIPAEHECQMVVQIACFGFDFVDWVAYDPRVLRMDNLIIQRFRPVASWVEGIEAEARKFLDEVETAWDQLIHSPLPGEYEVIGEQQALENKNPPNGGIVSTTVDKTP